MGQCLGATASTLDLAGVLWQRHSMVTRRKGPERGKKTVGHTPGKTNPSFSSARRNIFGASAIRKSFFFFCCTTWTCLQASPSYRPGQIAPENVGLRQAALTSHAQPWEGDPLSQASPADVPTAFILVKPFPSSSGCRCFRAFYRSLGILSTASSMEVEQTWKLLPSFPSPHVRKTEF